MWERRPGWALKAVCDSDRGSSAYGREASLEPGAPAGHTGDRTTQRQRWRRRTLGTVTARLCNWQKSELAVSGESANDRAMCALEAFIWHTQVGWMVGPDPTWMLKRCTQRMDFFSSKRHMYQWDALDLPFHIRSLFQKTTTHRDKGVLKWACSSCWWMWTDKTTGLHVSQKLQNGPVLWSLGIYPWKIIQTFVS